jgi:hypothetical protein
MNYQDTQELLEIQEQLADFLARRGFDETPLEDHAIARHGEAMYNTSKLVNTFLDLEREGYTAINLKIILDLINSKAVEGVNE